MPLCPNAVKDKKSLVRGEILNEKMRSKALRKLLHSKKKEKNQTNPTTTTTTKFLKSVAKPSVICISVSPIPTNPQITFHSQGKRRTIQLKSNSFLNALNLLLHFPLRKLEGESI